MKKTKLMSQLESIDNPEFVEELCDAMDEVRANGEAVLETPEGDKLVLTQEGDDVIVIDTEAEEATKLSVDPLDNDNIVMESVAVPEIESEDIPNEMPDEVVDTTDMEDAAMSSGDEDLDDIEEEDETGSEEEKCMSNSGNVMLVCKALKKDVELKMVERGEILAGEYSGDQVTIYVLPDDTVAIRVIDGKRSAMFEPLSKKDLNGDIVRKSDLVRDPKDLKIVCNEDTKFSARESAKKKKSNKKFSGVNSLTYRRKSKSFSDTPEEPEVVSSIVIEGIEGIGEEGRDAEVLEDLVIEVDNGIVDEDNPATKPFSFKFKNFSKNRAKKLVKAFCDTYYKAENPEDAESVEDVVEEAQKSMSDLSFDERKMYITSLDLSRPLEVELISGTSLKAGEYLNAPDKSETELTENEVKIEPSVFYKSIKYLKITHATGTVGYYGIVETDGISAADYEAFVAAGSLIGSFIILEKDQTLTEDYSDAEGSDESDEIDNLDVEPEIVPETETKSRKFSNTKRSVLNPLLHVEIN